MDRIYGWRPVAALLALGVASVLTGCGQRAARPGAPAIDGKVAVAASRSAGPPQVHQGWTSCAEVAPNPEPESGPSRLTQPLLADSFTATAAVLCRQGPQTRADGGQDLVATEDRAADVRDLVAALRQPDQAHTTGACPMYLAMVPWFALLDARGRWIQPGVPIDSCGQPRIEVRKALDRLSLTRVSSRVIREIRSAQSAASGCAQGWANMVSVETAAGRTAGRLTTSPLTGATTVRLCVYAVPDSERGTAKPGGTFVTGGPLSDDRRSAIDRALATAIAGSPASPPPCTTPAARFALLQIGAQGAVQLYVELDGCTRIMLDAPSGGPRLAQANAALLALLG